PVSRPLAFQNPQNCRRFVALKLPRRCACRILQICSCVTSLLLKRNTRFEYYRNAQTTPQETIRRTHWLFPIAGRCVSTNSRIHYVAFLAAEASSHAQSFAPLAAPLSAFPPLAATNAALACVFPSPPSPRSSPFSRE